MDRARARRTLWSLALGHVTIAFATVPVALLLRRDVIDDRLTESWIVNPVTGGLFLAIGQVMSCGRICALARATTDCIDIDQAARALRRSGWSVALSLTAIIFGLQFLLAAPVSPLLLTLFLMLIIASLLLEYSYAGWVHHRLNSFDEHGTAAVYRQLPPRIGSRLRKGQPVAAGAHAMFGGMAAILLLAAIVTESRSATGVSLTMFVQILAAAAATAVPLIHIRAVLLIRTAIVDDMVHLPTLRRAGASFIRADTAAAPLTAFVIASVLAAPAAPMVAIGRAALLVYVLSVATLQFASLNSIQIGDVPKRWTRTAGAR